MKFIKITEVISITGLGRSSIYAFMNKGQFPKPVSLSDRAVAWIESEVHDWMMDKIALRDNENA